MDHNIRRPGLKAFLGLATLTAVVLAGGCAPAGNTSQPLLKVEMGAGYGSQGTLTGLQLIVLLTVLSLAPAILLLLTSFTRIIIVLSFIRTAIGVPQAPPNQVLLGLGLFLTIFVMAPVWQKVNDNALQPYLRGDLAEERAMEQGMEPLRDFMLKQTRQKDLALFMSVARMERPKGPEDIPNHVLIPAFVISELKTGFQMGFLIFVPFLVIDMVVSSAMLSMGMLMLPPMVISLPFKILLFVLADGWHLVVKSLLTSFS